MQTRFAILLALGVTAACAAGSTDNDDAGQPTADAAPKKDASTTKNDASSSSNDAGTTNDASTDAQTADEPDAAPPQAIVYGHSPDTLYTFDPNTHAVTLVAAFSGCSQSLLTQVIDLAIDSKMNAYATTFDGIYSVDLSIASCTLIKTGSYPNSLSFVPAGTLDSSVEALVGYFGSSYVRIDPSTGDVTSVGTLTGGYASSGDIVSVAGGGTFLTVTGNGCGDCLLQVDPTTGDMIQNYGQLTHGAVYGLGYWAGSLYGFDSAGDLFSISGGAGDAGLTTTDIALDAGVTWWGAGSTTNAPAASADGGAIATE